MELTKVNKIRKIATKVVLDTLLAFVFAIMGIGLIYRATGKTFYFYNTRYDVVLTDSMSVKNEAHKDFLEGHNNQIKPFDLVISEKITEKTKLNVYDIVLFDNPDIGTDMHRIVDIDVVGDKVELNNLKKDTFQGKETFSYQSPASSIVVKDNLMFKEFIFVSYSEAPLTDEYYYFNVNNASVAVTYNSEDMGGYYKNTVTYSKESSSPVKFSITKKSYSYNDHIESISLTGADHDVVFGANEVSGEEQQTLMFNTSEKYLIRGDKAKTDDGWYTRDKLYSKVSAVAPKLGYVVRFLASPWGTIMVVGIILIPIVASYLMKRKEEKSNEA